ncbi:glycosyltransferase family 4 protein [Rhodococcus sp. IEGM 1381]|uniref:glycosyltransferase family 4 protein n=1 Tax=Rhodococcus sp. IEGM 1381 TaxID=3047085 RepID=UPI0024B6E5E6|nr:glycosyltransferase family 4 protein [Rhodococcus sp. IEGM 1381]MDI9894238.1 glycosyltransferase family 4 protein [Rhodococcus sp. IEGM 1381]
MRPLRIGILGLNYAPEPTGIAPYTADFASGLNERGHEVSVITGYPHYPQWSVDPRYGGTTLHEVIDGVPVTRLRHVVPSGAGAAGRVRMEASFGARLVTAAWPEVDLLVCVSPALLATGMASLRARVSARFTPIGIWVQDLYGPGASETGLVGSRGARWTATLEGRILRSADSVVVAHEQFQQQLVGRYSLDPERVVVIRNWTHLSVVPKVDRDCVRARLGWAQDEIVVLHTGNMGVKQELDNVVEAAKLVDQQSLRVRFLLVGDGNRRTHLEGAARGVRSIEFHRPYPQGQYAEALAAADVLLVNEKRGLSQMSIPSKLTSYFSSGTAILAATDAGSITRREVERSGAGVAVAAGDPHALLDGVLGLAANPGRAAAMGRRGVEYVSDALTRTAALDRFEAWAHATVASHSERRRR